MSLALFGQVLHQKRNLCVRVFAETILSLLLSTCTLILFDAIINVIVVIITVIVIVTTLLVSDIGISACERWIANVYYRTQILRIKCYLRLKPS